MRANREGYTKTAIVCAMVILSAWILGAEVRNLRSTVDTWKIGSLKAELNSQQLDSLVIKLSKLEQKFNHHADYLNHPEAVFDACRENQRKIEEIDAWIKSETARLRAEMQERFDIISRLPEKA